jgi:hypothetical protein
MIIRAYKHVKYRVRTDYKILYKILSSRNALILSLGMTEHSIMVQQ